MNRIVLETNRLQLREMTLSDMSALSLILQDEKVMYAYNGALAIKKPLPGCKSNFNDIRLWIGLWGVFLKDYR